MLVLFDIDGTLLRGHGCGLAALIEAGERVCGVPMSGEGIELGGRLDPDIWHDLATANGVDDPAVHLDEVKHVFAERLRAGFASGRPAEPLPGALMLVERVYEDQGVEVGVLTGNFEATGRLKLASAGFDHERFAVCAWGDDAATRAALVAVGVDRFHAIHGRPPRDIVIVGDTPNDVSCAKANDARVLAVTTGTFGRPALAGADRVVDDLLDTDDLAAWLLGNPAPTTT